MLTRASSSVKLIATGILFALGQLKGSAQGQHAQSAPAKITFAGLHFEVPKEMRTAIPSSEPGVFYIWSSDGKQVIAFTKGKEVAKQAERSKIEIELRLKQRWDTPTFDKFFDTNHSISPPRWTSFGRNKFFGRWGTSSGEIHAEGYLLVNSKRLQLALYWYDTKRSDSACKQFSNVIASMHY